VVAALCLGIYVPPVVEGRAWILVLGASSGFGSAVSVELARKGFDVCGVHLDRRSTIEAAERTRSEIESAGARALFFNLNACDGDKRDQVLDALCEACTAGRLRLLFHSLAFGSLLPLVGEDPGSSARANQLEMTLDVMANSLVYWTQAVIWRGLMGEGGRVLAMTSAGATKATSCYGPVSAAKAALEAYVRQLALELAPRKITVNAVRAGVTDTAAARKIPSWEAVRARALSLNPNRRLTEPADVARAVALLIEPGTQWLTGNVIGLDGGEDIAG
jgi:NAD(P)-dependent dehydrogenase (short-subunit alcohol dehydrogenase family)